MTRVNLKNISSGCDGISESHTPQFPWWSGQYCFHIPFRWHGRLNGKGPALEVNLRSVSVLGALATSSPPDQSCWVIGLQGAVMGRGAALTSTHWSQRPDPREDLSIPPSHRPHPVLHSFPRSLVFPPPCHLFPLLHLLPLPSHNNDKCLAVEHWPTQ